MIKSGALTAVLSLAMAFLLAVLSVYVQRTVPETTANGNVCGPTHSDLCMEPQLKGGFPFAFLYDVPAVSVSHQLGFGEDDFHPGSFALDVVFYFVVSWLLLLWRRSRLRQAAR